MKTKIILGLFIIFGLTVSTTLAQEMTLTTTPANIISSRASIDLPGLTGNPFAIIVAKPLGNTATLNPHPIGAWYYNGKWNIFNTDHKAMPAGLTFKIQYFTNQSENNFLHQVGKENLQGASSYIDNPLLNNNPNAQVTIFQNHAPGHRSASLNPYEATTEYDPTAGKWCIKNVGGEPLYPNTAYNVVISGGRINAESKPIAIKELPKTPNPIPNGNAGGDLSGTYPNPKVVGLYGRPLSSIQPKIGDTLRWDGTQWMPSGNSLEPLKFNPTLGKKIILYPGQTGDVGLSVQGNLLQIHSDNPNADVAIGYDQAGTFNEKFRVKANGAIAVSGDAGQNGQVLTSNGGASPPTWKQPSGNGIQTYFNKEFNFTIVVSDLAPEHKLSSISQTLTLDKKSRVIISASADVYYGGCVLGCSPPRGVFQLGVNRQTAPALNGEVIVHFVTQDGFQTIVMPSFMIDLNPGTHKIEFWVSKMVSSSVFNFAPKSSSIMVIPIE